ncbi:MAG: hypothetical protein ACNI28_03660 [Arcobacter sp.]|uniref:polysaccharide deacetylase WbmS family protein n=1 Tax=Arcobacter sp. TaxID=1872629 RepID=UPI003B0024F4
MFDIIENIDVNDLEWKNKIFLTFDIDWASDEVLEYTLDIIEKNNLKATVFVTHDTVLLDRMKSNKNIELGIHPNFNPLVNGDFRYGKNLKEVLEYYLNFVPNAKSVRSHDLKQKTELLKLFSEYGLTYDCNIYLPHNSGIINKPFKHFDNKLLRVPHFWEDDIHCLYEDSWIIDDYLKYDGIKVFDFHPIHIFLNTENLNRYENSREWHREHALLQEHKNVNHIGVEGFLYDIIRRVNEHSNNR